MLTMKTAETDATPSNNFVVGRVRRNLLRNSWIGGLLTSRDSAAAHDASRVYGSDVHFQFFDRLEFDSYLLRSDTPGRSGKNQARRFLAGWADDELAVSAEYNAVQANFNPELGFIRRGNISHYAGDLSWKPQMDSSEIIRNLNFEVGTNYYEDGSGRLETRAHDATLGLQFENGGSVNLVTTEMFDRLRAPFAIRSNVAVPAGDYSSLNYTANFNTGQSRKIYANGNVIWGDFWDGRNTSASTSLGWRPAPPA